MREKGDKRENISAVRWGLGGTMAEFVLQFLVQVAMARLLGPETYGLAALGLLVLGLGNLLCQGWSWGVVQAREISHEQVRVVFTWQALFGLAVAGAMAGGAHWIAAWFQEPRVIPLLLGLAPAVLMAALSSTPINLAKRQMDFRYLQLTGVTSYAIAYLVLGLPLAMLGYGIWAPVAGALLNAFCVFAFIWARPQSRLRPLFRHPGAVLHAGVGMTAVLTNACNWLINSIDRMVLGRLLSASALGNYAVGSNLASIPANVVLSGLQPAFLAASARMQDDLPRMRRAYLGALATTWVVLSPLFVLLAVLAPDLVSLLYGPKWEHAGTVLQIVACAMPAYISWGLSTPVLWSTGKKHLESGLQLPLLPLVAAAFWLAASHGMQALAATAAAIAILRALIFVAIACRQLEVRPQDLWPLLWRGASGILLTAALSLPIAELLRAQDWSPLSLLVAVSALVLPLLALLAWCFPVLLGDHASSAIVRLAPPLKALVPSPKP